MALHVDARERRPRSAEIFRRLWVSLGLARSNWPGRYTLLLFSILLMILAQPIFASHTEAREFATISLSLLLLVALYTLNLSRAYFVFGAMLMIPAFATRWVLEFYRTEQLEVFAASTAGAFIFVTVIALVRELFSVKRVTLDSISGAICAYLLLGVGWAFIFAVVELEHRGSFSAGLFLATTHGSTQMMSALHNFIYYSFVCLTTTGYGDIAPKSDVARVLSILESITGQMYLAVLIARLVSLQVAQSMNSDRS